MNINWNLLHFAGLSPAQLYAALQLRAEVFVVEQNCVYLDLDGKDAEAFHLLGMHNDNLVAYTRLLAPGAAFPEASIGRVVTSPKVRRTGAGKLLMERSIEAVYALYGGPQPIQIGAQLYLQKFYEGFGFRVTGDVYLEDNIPHVHMIKP